MQHFSIDYLWMIDNKPSYSSKFSGMFSKVYNLAFTQLAEEEVVEMLLGRLAVMVGGSL